METLYRKVAVSEKPKKSGTYFSNEGEVYYRESTNKFEHNYDAHCVYPDWWLEEIPDTTTQLQADNKKLRQWKKEAMEVMANFQLEEIGKVLNLKLGTSVSEQVLPQILKLQTDKAELLEMLEKCLEVFEIQDNEQEKLKNEALNLIKKIKNNL